MQHTSAAHFADFLRKSLVWWRASPTTAERHPPDPVLPQHQSDLNRPDSGSSTKSESSSMTMVEDSPDGPHVNSLARRIHGWSWQAFPIGMGTSAVFLTFSGHTENNKGLDVLEIVFFILTITIFCLNTLTLLLQAILYPKHAWRLLKSPQKSVFVPLIVLSFASIVIGLIEYRNIDADAAYALFWTYVVFAIITCFPMLFIWFNQAHDIFDFSPAYAFLIFPMMLVGVVSYNVLKVVDASEERSIGVLLTGYFFQGLGFFMTFFYICIYILRLIMTGFLTGRQANGAFIACGPPGFTALALIQLGDKAQKILPRHNLISPNAGEIWFAGSVMSGIMLLGLAVFFFLFAVIPYWFKVEKRLHHILGCWALTFPNVGWILALRVLGNLFDLRGFKILHFIFCVVLAVVWFVLFVLTIVAFWKGFIFQSEDEAVVKDRFYLLGRKHGLDTHRHVCQRIAITDQASQTTPPPEHTV